ncbi:hypothetical protein, partial [Halorubrum ezzemoulense]
AEAAAGRLTAALDLGRRVEDARAVASAGDRLADLLAGNDAGPEPIDREALRAALREAPPEAVPPDSAADPAAYREIAERWRVDGDGVAASYPALG